MNYRHAFHAGNAADVWKHLILILSLDHLRRKDAPFRAIDAFAGVGLYDLESDEARRSPEWRLGVARVREAAAADFGAVPPAVVRCLAALDAAGDGPSTYAGSPALIANALRPADRAIFCELHPDDSETLAARFASARGVKVERRDGWQAVRAHLPPPERRGLILIDPPFEREGEFDRMVKALEDGLRRFATGTFLVWHADKNPTETAAYLRDAAALGARALVAGLAVDAPGAGRGLVASGLVVVNPPHTLEADLAEAGPWLSATLARGPGARVDIRRLSGVW